MIFMEPFSLPFLGTVHMCLLQNPVHFLLAALTHYLEGLERCMYSLKLLSLVLVALRM